MDEWLDSLADALGEPRMSAGELGELLKLTRDVAHGVERQFAPLSAFLAGAAVGRRTAEGTSREDAFRFAAGTVRDLVPQDAEPASAED